MNGMITPFKMLAEITDLRRKLKKSGYLFKVVKNRLTKLALEKAGYEELNEYMTGPTALTIAESDPVAATKIISDFIKEHENLKLKVGLIEGALADEEQLKRIAKLPSRNVLLSEVVSCIQGPIRNLVYALKGVTNNLVYVIDAIHKQKEEAG